MDRKVALITGVTGQDGAYLAELLLEKGYEVHGVKRRSSSFNTGRIEDIYQDPHAEHRRFHLHYGDMTDATNLIRIVQEVQPAEIYNLAAQDPEDPGVLILSRFAGAAQQLQDALLVNPHSPDDLAHNIGKALDMPLAERKARWENLMQTVTQDNVVRWRENFVADLKG